MALTLLASAGAKQTTTGINTTGATAIILFHGGYDTSGTVSDSKGNTWTALTEGVNSHKGRIYYNLSPNVGTGHTFSSSQTYGAIFALVFTGETLTYSSESGSTGSGTSASPGSISPASAGNVLITGNAFGATYSGLSINSGFTITNSVAYAAGTVYGGSAAYLIQTSSSSQNPTWSWTGSSGFVTRMACFTYPYVSSDSATPMLFGGGVTLS